MYIKMSDFFLGMGKPFTVQVLDIAEKLYKEEGDVYFWKVTRPNIFMYCSKGE